MNNDCRTEADRPFTGRWVVRLRDAGRALRRETFPWRGGPPECFRAWLPAAELVRGMLTEHEDWTALGVTSERWSETLSRWVAED